MSNPNISINVTGPQQSSDTTPMTILELTETVNKLKSSIDRSATDLPDDLTEDDAGFNMFSTTLGKPVWWNGTTWVDATGTEI